MLFKEEIVTDPGNKSLSTHEKQMLIESGVAPGEEASVERDHPHTSSDTPYLHNDAMLVHNDGGGNLTTTSTDHVPQ